MGTVHLDRRFLLTLLCIAVFLPVATAGLTDFLFGPDPPMIKDGDFTIQKDQTLFALSGQSCSSDSDCPQTQCVGDNYYVDTGGSGTCVYNEQDSQYECGGYDKVYSDADYCGGRYDYNCDSSGCDGYKAACEDDCSANSGCDTYDFCSDDDDSSSGSSSSGSGSSSSSCSDQCTEHTRTCSDGTVVECRDTDGDGCTDDWVEIAACDGACNNAVCVQDTSNDDTAPDTGDDGDKDRSAADRLVDGAQAMVATATNSVRSLLGMIGF